MKLVHNLFNNSLSTKQRRLEKRDNLNCDTDAASLTATLLTTSRADMSRRKKSPFDFMQDPGKIRSLTPKLALKQASHNFGFPEISCLYLVLYLRDYMFVYIDKTELNCMYLIQWLGSI